jgi:hypothetical protein
MNFRGLPAPRTMRAGVAGMTGTAGTAAEAVRVRVASAPPAVTVALELSELVRSFT